MGVILGIIYHFIGGFASGSFYMPYKKVKGWHWENDCLYYLLDKDQPVAASRIFLGNEFEYQLKKNKCMVSKK